MRSHRAAVMTAVLRLLFATLLARLRSRFQLEIENLVLRHQVDVLRRAIPRRLRLSSSERLLFVWPYKGRTMSQIPHLAGVTDRLWESAIS